MLLASVTMKNENKVVMLERSEASQGGGRHLWFTSPPRSEILRRPSGVK